MRHIRELPHLHFEQGLSQRLIARSLGVVRSTVERVLTRFASGRGGSCRVPCHLIVITRRPSSYRSLAPW